MKLFKMIMIILQTTYAYPTHFGANKNTGVASKICCCALQIAVNAWGPGRLEEIPGPWRDPGDHRCLGRPTNQPGYLLVVPRVCYGGLPAWQSGPRCSSDEQRGVAFYLDGKYYNVR